MEESQKIDLEHEKACLGHTKGKKTTWWGNTDSSPSHDRQSNRAVACPGARPAGMGDDGTRTISSESAQLHNSNFCLGGQNHCVGGSLAFPPTQSRMNAHLATPAARVYPNMWPLQTPMQSLMLDPAFFCNGAFTAGAQRAAMQQAGMSANVLSLGRVFPFGLDIAEGRLWGIPPAPGEVQSLASMNTAPSVSKNETERKRQERGKTKDLWSKLDALVPANGKALSCSAAPRRVSPKRCD